MIKLLLRSLYLLYLYIPVYVYYLLYGTDNNTIEYLKDKIILSGPLFIKITQWLIQRPDIIQQKYINELKSLQSYCKEVPLDDIINNINININNKLKCISKNPLGVGSIAQVHLAILHNNRKVVVKVRHPHIENVIATDIKILSFIIKLIPQCKVIDFNYLFKNISNQIYLDKEKENLESLKNIFQDDPDINFPEIIYSNKKVIIETYCPGIHINECNDEEYLSGKKLIAQKFVMMIKKGVVHGDLHDGNVLSDINNNGKITVIDFGMVIRLTEEERKILSHIVRGYIAFYKTGHYKRLLKYLLKTDEKGLIESKEVEIIINECTTVKNGKTLFLVQNLDTFLSKISELFIKNKTKMNDNILYCLLMISVIESDITNRYNIDFVENFISDLKFT